MHIPELHESKKDFQLERIILFTDAVFAIAITLLIIEIKPPELEHYSRRWMSLLPLIPKFVGFIVSFSVIGIYWRSHHRIFGYLVNYDEKLITLNLMFLFLIVCLPFSSAFSSENYGETVSTVFYFLNLIAVGLLNFFLLKHIAHSKNKISDLTKTPYLYEFFRAKTLVVFIVFLICMVVDINLKGLGRPMLILIMPMMIYIKNYYRKKQLKTEEV